MGDIRKFYVCKERISSMGKEKKVLVKLREGGSRWNPIQGLELGPDM